MNKIIYKHQLPWGEYTETKRLNLVKGATVLKVGTVNGIFCLWEMHDIILNDPPPVETEERMFMVVGTGVAFPSFGKNKRIEYIGTGFTDDFYVWHVFEIKEY